MVWYSMVWCNIIYLYCALLSKGRYRSSYRKVLNIYYCNNFTIETKPKVYNKNNKITIHTIMINNN